MIGMYSVRNQVVLKQQMRGYLNKIVDIKSVWVIIMNIIILNGKFSAIKCFEDLYTNRTDEHDYE